MKKLWIQHPDYGHKEFTVEEDINTEFEKIMKGGYGDKIPVVFIAEKKDGSVERATGKDADRFLKDPDVVEVGIFPSLAGG
jgi:hypothetical protein